MFATRRRNICCTLRWSKSHLGIKGRLMMAFRNIINFIASVENSISLISVIHCPFISFTSLIHSSYHLIFIYSLYDITLFFSSLEFHVSYLCRKKRRTCVWGDSGFCHGFCHSAHDGPCDEDATPSTVVAQKGAGLGLLSQRVSVW